MIDDLIIVVIIININLLCIFSLAVHFLLLLFWTKRSMQISKQTIQCEKNKFFSLVWFHFKAFRFTHFCYFLLLKLKCGIFFLKIACQVMKTEFHPWSMEAQEKESGDNQYNLGIGNWNWNDKTLKRKQKEEWSREGVKSQQKKRGQNLRKGVKIWEKGLESEKKGSKSEEKRIKIWFTEWSQSRRLCCNLCLTTLSPEQPHNDPLSWAWDQIFEANLWYFCSGADLLAGVAGQGKLTCWGRRAPWGSLEHLPPPPYLGLSQNMTCWGSQAIQV